MLKTEAGQDLTADLEDPLSSYIRDGQPRSGHSFSRFAHERKAGEEAHVVTSSDEYGSSNAGQQDETSRESQAVVSTTESAAADGVQSPISLADGLADMHAEADADTARSHAASRAPDEPDTCILFRPQAVHAKAAEASLRTGNHASRTHLDEVSEQRIVSEEERFGGAEKPDQEHGSAAGALGQRSASKADTSGPQPSRAAGTALQLFSPMEAVKAISRVESDARDTAKQAAQPFVTSSGRAAPQAVASSQTGLRQRAQRYSKVHAVGAQQRSLSRASSSVQAGHTEPGDGGVHRTTAEADVAHVIPLSSMARSASAAPALTQQTGHAPVRMGKENGPPALSTLASASTTPEKSYQMGSGFSVQDNPLSATEPSPEVPPSH